MVKVSSSPSPSPALLRHPLSSPICRQPPKELAASWILEFILRQPIPDHLAHGIFLSLPFSSTSLHPHLSKTLLLHRLSSDILRRSLSDSTLHSLELMEELDRLRGASSSPHLKAAYCAAAVACTAEALRRGAGDFADAVERIWMARIADLIRSEAAAGLVSQELVEWGKRMERWRSTEGGSEKLLDRNVEEAVRVVGDYMDSALKEMGPPFLEIVAAEVLENRMDSNGSAEMEGDDLRGVAKIYRCFGRLEEKCKGLEDDGFRESSGFLEETWKDLNDAGVTGQDTTDHGGGGGPHKLDTAEVRKVKEALKKSCFEKQMLFEDPLPEEEASAASVLASMAGGNVFLNETAKHSSKGNTVLSVPVDMVAGVSTGVDSSTGALEKEKCDLVSLPDFVRRKPLEGHHTVKECNKDAEPNKHGDIVDHHSLFERNPTAHTREMTSNTRFNYRRGRLKKQVTVQKVTTPTTSIPSLTPTTNQPNSTPPLTTITNPVTFPPPLITTTTSPAFTPPLTPTTTQPAFDHLLTTTTTTPISTPPPQYQLPSYAFPTLHFTYPPQYPPTSDLPSSTSIIPPHNHPFVHPILYTYPPYCMPHNIGIVSSSIPPMQSYPDPPTQSSPNPPTQSSPNPPTQSPHVTPTQESQEETNSSNVKKLIEPLGNGFSDQTAIRYLKVVIKSKFDAPYISWKKIPIKKSYFWLPSHHHKIRAIFEKRCAARLKDILGDIRGAEEKPDWLTEMVWLGLRTQWSTPEYVNKREQYKRNRASNCGGLGTSLHTGGSISHTEHSKRLKNLMGRDPSLSELFTRTHQRKKDKTWVDPRSEQIFNNFVRLHEQQSSQGSTSELPQSEFQMWTQAVGGVKKKGHIYGLGSEGHVFANTHQDKYSGSSDLDEHIEKIASQKVAALTTQFQIQLEQNQQMMNQLYQQLNSRPSQGQHISQSSVEHIGKDIRHGHVDENKDEDTEDDDTEQ